MPFLNSQHAAIEMLINAETTFRFSVRTVAVQLAAVIQKVVEVTLDRDDYFSAHEAEKNVGFPSHILTSERKQIEHLIGRLQSARFSGTASKVTDAAVLRMLDFYDEKTGE